MIIDLIKLQEDGEDFVGEETLTIDDFKDAGDVIVIGPVEYDFHVQYVSDRLIVYGKLATEVKFRCSRCSLEFAKAVIDSDFDSVRDVEPGDSSVDLTQDMREAIILAFPTYPLCSQSCKGLCSDCGIDLNKGGCECKPRQDDRWGGLDGLSI